MVEGGERALGGVLGFLARCRGNEHYEPGRLCLRFGFVPVWLGFLAQVISISGPSSITAVNEWDAHTEGTLSRFAGGTKLQRGGHYTQNDGNKIEKDLQELGEMKY